MKPEVAMKNIENVLAQFKGNLQEHVAIQESLKVIKAIMVPAPALPPKKK